MSGYPRSKKKLLGNIIVRMTSCMSYPSQSPLFDHDANRQLVSFLHKILGGHAVRTPYHIPCNTLQPTTMEDF